MATAKTSIFLLFLIIGTSVFPNSRSTGLTYAKPAPFSAKAALGAASSVMDIVGNLKNLLGGSDPANDQPIVNTQTSYGSVTNQKCNNYTNDDVSGKIIYGSSTNQNNNNFG